MKWLKRKHMAIVYFSNVLCPFVVCLHLYVFQAKRMRTNTNQESQHELPIVTYITIKTVSSVWTCKILLYLSKKKLWSRRSGTFFYQAKMHTKRNVYFNKKKLNIFFYINIKKCINIMFHNFFHSIFNVKFSWMGTLDFLFRRHCRRIRFIYDKINKICSKKKIKNKNII